MPNPTRSRATLVQMVPNPGGSGALRVLVRTTVKQTRCRIARQIAAASRRHGGRPRPVDEVDDVGASRAAPGPAERALADEDAQLVARAFSDLPERWRSVLWLTEVEGIPAREVATRLGLTANGAAQLAVRARAGLRERYLQAHVQAVPAPKGCRYARERLGAYVGRALSARDLAKGDQ